VIRKDKSAEKREDIARIATDVFFAKGYKEASLRDISVSGKLSKAGIYHYFPTKSEILSYLMVKSANGLIDAITQGSRIAKGEKLDPRETFELICRKYLGYLLKNRKSSSIVLRDRHQLTGQQKEKLMEKERTIFHLVRDKLCEISNIDNSKNLNLMTFQVISGMHWMGYWFDPKGPLSVDESSAQLMNNILNGVLNSGARLNKAR